MTDHLQKLNLFNDTQPDIPLKTNLVKPIRFSIPQGSIVSQPIVMKLFTHIDDNILHQVTVAGF